MEEVSKERPGNKELGCLTKDVANIKLSTVTNIWLWKADSLGLFFVRSLRMMLSKNLEDIASKWIKWATLKANCFLWHMLSNKVSIASNLVLRGIVLYNSTCSLCGMDEESLDHLFFKCEFWS